MHEGGDGRRQFKQGEGFLHGFLLLEEVTFQFEQPAGYGLGVVGLGIEGVVVDVEYAAEVGDGCLGVKDIGVWGETCIEFLLEILI